MSSGHRAFRARAQRTWLGHAIKRGFDILAAIFLLLATLPLQAVIAFGVWWSVGRPIFFRQRRPGRDEKLFTLIKFRTMRDLQDMDGHQLPDADRLTRLGRFLRRTSLDELPELWNVVRGEMSLVGPRPLLPEYLPLYNEKQRRRHELRPGLTGWAQIHGRNALDWEQRLELDVWYVDHWSNLLDAVIICRSVAIVISGYGVAQPGHASVERFRGQNG